MKVGDRVRQSAHGFQQYGNQSSGGLGTVRVPSVVSYVTVRWDNGGYELNYHECDLELVNQTSSMNLKEKFTLAITAEPKKSFRKAGITNGDDILTDDGTKVFLTWLLHSKYAEEFKKEVVDDLLKAECKDK